MSGLPRFVDRDPLADDADDAHAHADADLDLDDDNATMIAQRPAQFAKKRGMLPKERGSESLQPRPDTDDPRGERPTSIPPPRGTEPHLPVPPPSAPARAPSGRRGR